MFSTAIDYLSNAFVAGAIGLVCGVIFSQKIKDWITGVPADFRTLMKSVEADVKTKAAAAVADVFAKVAPVAVKPPAPPVPPPAPVVQAAPAPHA